MASKDVVLNVQAKSCFHGCLGRQRLLMLKAAEHTPPDVSTDHLTRTTHRRAQQSRFHKTGPNVASS